MYTRVRGGSTRDEKKSRRGIVFGFFSPSPGPAAFPVFDYHKPAPAKPRTATVPHRDPEYLHTLRAGTTRRSCRRISCVHTPRKSGPIGGSFFCRPDENAPVQRWRTRTHIHIIGTKSYYNNVVILDVCLSRRPICKSSDATRCTPSSSGLSYAHNGCLHSTVRSENSNRQITAAAAAAARTNVAFCICTRGPRLPAHTCERRRNTEGEKKGDDFLRIAHIIIILDCTLYGYDIPDAISDPDVPTRGPARGYVHFLHNDSRRYYVFFVYVGSQRKDTRVVSGIFRRARVVRARMYTTHGTSCIGSFAHVFPFHTHARVGVRTTNIRHYGPRFKKTV